MRQFYKGIMKNESQSIHTYQRFNKTFHQEKTTTKLEKKFGHHQREIDSNVMAHKVG